MQHTLTVEDLRKLVEEGKNFSDIARTYGISPQAVQQKAQRQWIKNAPSIFSLAIIVIIYIIFI